MEYFQGAVRVSPSQHGLGVFSTRSLAVHELIGPIRGTIIDDPDYGSEYCMEIGKDSVLEPEGPFRFVNHSCQPNCRLLEVEPESAGKETAAAAQLWLEVLSDIAPGDQITIDYAWPADGAIPCDCGAPECRGWIVSAAEQYDIDPRRPPDPS
jgi:hypothetical protein